MTGFTLKKTRSRWYPAKTMTDADYSNDIVPWAKTLIEAKDQLHSEEQASEGTDLNYIYCDAKNFLIPKPGLYFRKCEDGAGWHLIPCRISPRSEFFSRAHKNWHIMWGINLWPDWPPLARGSKFHTIHTPTKAASLPPLE